MRFARILILAALLASGLGIGICHVARAADMAPPSEMSPLDAARLDAAMAHIQQLQIAAMPYQETVKGICDHYRIDPALLGSKVRVDTQTGAITRGK